MISYRTIEGECTASYEIQKSKFLAHIKHVTNEEEAREYIAKQKKTYFDARHNCSAWVLGEKADKQKSNDDGEPGGTAGAPILDILLKNELTNIVAVITRYFGGIKLGAGGLIRAYSHCTVLGIESAAIIEMTLFQRVQLQCSYSLFNPITTFLRQKEIRTEDTSYAEYVTLSLLLPPNETEDVLNELTNLTAARCKLERKDLVLLPIPCGK